MKKLILFSALALFVFATVGCEKNKEEQKEEKEQKKCYKLYYEKLQKSNFTQEGVVTYSNEYKEYMLVHGTTSEGIDFAKYYLFCPQLEPKFCKEGIKLRVIGNLYHGAEPSEDGTHPKGGALMGVYRLKNYTITQIK